jgi:hypothetical protein
MSSTYSQKNINGMIWLNQRRDLFNYDERGRVTKQFIMYWISGMWTNMYLFWNHFDGDGNMVQREVKVYDPVTKTWGFQQQNFYNYTGNLISDYMTMVWDKNSSSWINKQQFFYEYDADGNVTLYIEQNWDPVLGNWRNTYRETTAFNDMEDEVSRVTELWDDLTGTWEYSEQSMMDYDLSGNLIRRTIQNWAPEGYWENIKMTEYFIGLNVEEIGHKVAVCHNGHTIYVSRMALPAHLGHGDCVGHCLNEERGKEAGGMNGHLKSAYVEAESLQAEVTRVYPNPFSESFSIEPGKDLTNFYKVEIFDLAGKVVRTISVNGTDKITIMRENLARGVYFIRLYGDQVLTQKVMIQ